MPGPPLFLQALGKQTQAEGKDESSRQQIDYWERLQRETTAPPGPPRTLATQDGAQSGALAAALGRPERAARSGRSLLAPLTAAAADADPGAGGAGVRGAHHHVAVAGGAADSGGDNRGSSGGAEIATDDATAGAADACGEEMEAHIRRNHGRSTRPLPGGDQTRPAGGRDGPHYLQTFTEPTPSHSLRREEGRGQCHGKGAGASAAEKRARPA
ncbi:hypothetical protein P7K49_019800 [Saguinus oedipus]|uniref:Uncharacterized protein n=1 Tax=Saguinus oedipus TaxID=9490 RepID=A0ABQ9UYH8_SAGOE|nr:hypothetical protein P7K49_019800 [Saguinus oedipus]